MTCKSPVQICSAMVAGGKGKTQQTFINTILLSFLAGAYIAFGGALAIRATGSLPPEIWGSLAKFIFGAVFPVGLLLVLIAGADLFTGNCMTVPTALYHGEVNVGGLCKSWILSWVGNLIGSLFVAYFMCYITGLFMEPIKVGDTVKNLPWAISAIKIANAKTSLTFGAAFWRAVGCNWLVCLAIWVAAAADDITGKIIGLWFPIMGFVAIGYEHSVANMFFIPLGIYLGNDPAYIAFAKSAAGIAAHAPLLKANWNGLFIKNLIPVTLGNIVGAAIFVGAIYTGIYGKKLATGLPKDVESKKSM